MLLETTEQNYGKPAMIDTSLCYIERDGQYLMLHRTKKQNDLNEGKWIGVGGKREDFESINECLVREVYEETGLRLTKFEPRAIIYFYSDKWEDEKMFLYTASEFILDDGRTEKDFVSNSDIPIKPCAEGELAWIDKEKLLSLNIWEADRFFIEKLLEDAPFFFMGATYRGDEMVDSFIGAETFADKVYQEVARIPEGKVSTYSDIAALIGHPGAQRAVGNVLHRNPYDGFIPCHRVVNAKGCPAPRFCFDGPEEQLLRLAAEGVKIKDGRVILEEL